MSQDYYTICCLKYHSKGVGERGGGVGVVPSPFITQAVIALWHKTPLDTYWLNSALL